MHHPQVMQSPIVNDFLKVEIDGPTDPQLVIKLLFQVSIIELHNKLVRATMYVVLKEARYEYDNIIISDSTLISLFPPQFKNFVKLQGRVWLRMLNICQKYTFTITIMA